MAVVGVDLVYLAPEGADYLVPEKMNYGMKLVPQLGFQYLSATLKTAGHQCRIYDQPILGFTPEKLMALLDENPDRAVGFYTDSFLKPKITAWISHLRKRGLKKTLLIGGPGSYGAAEYLKAGADFVVHGEGERTILEILDHLNGKGAKENLKGVTYKDNDFIIDTPARELIENIDSLPFPDRDEYPIRSYHDFHMFPMRVPFVSVLSSRGCPNTCTFCSSPNIWGRKVRMRSCENMLAEIDMLVEKYDAKFLGFKDDMFAIRPSWLKEFTEGMIRRDNDLHFSCNIHPFSFKNSREESVELLARSGCRLMVAGLQSVDPQVLKNINRSADEPKMLMELARIIKKNDIALVVEFIFGLPLDSRQSWDNALKWSQKAGPHYALFYSLSKLEGSVIGEKYKDKEVTPFSEKEIRQGCANAQKKFFTTPKNILRDFWFVIRKNPRWFLYVARNIGYIIGGIGIKLKRKKPHVEQRTL